MGSTNTYEYDPQLGVFRLDRVLHSPMHFPGDYGLVPGTIAEDGEPLDILCLTSQPSFPGCSIEVRPVGRLDTLDVGQVDHKLVAVPAKEPRFSGRAGDAPRAFVRHVGEQADYAQQDDETDSAFPGDVLLSRCRPSGWCHVWSLLLEPAVTSACTDISAPLIASAKDWASASLPSSSGNRQLSPERRQTWSCGRSSPGR